ITIDALYVIKSFKITVIDKYEPNIGFSADGVLVSTLSGYDLSAKVEGLSATTISIQNVNTTNTQLRITQIEIEYGLK
ncbi:hypothetical protein, partial [Acholeplasma laidlawii]|uniref:hypothetical protein n=1 Tax=Acholeplasma laidlawii TaxID=2148 RepID=UPI0014486F72